MEEEDPTRDTRNKRGGKLEEDLNKVGGGLKMAKKSNNFKEMEKAQKRMMEKRKIQADAKRQERLERKEEMEQKKWNDEG